MKTTGIQRKKWILIFSVAVITSCLLSIMVPRASVRNSATTTVSANQLSLMVQTEPEAVLAVEDWMLNFQNK